jgi:hypothetical protein
LFLDKILQPFETDDDQLTMGSSAAREFAGSFSLTWKLPITVTRAIQFFAAGFPAERSLVIP